MELVRTYLKLSAFHHIAMRWILGISMTSVRDEQIKNSKVRRAFCNLLNITYYITRMKKSKGKTLTLYPGDLWELGSTVHGKLDNLK